MTNSNKIAWVTGGRGGIGSAVCDALSDMNCQVWSIGRDNRNDLVVDLRDYKKTEKAIKHIRYDKDMPDILITCHAAEGGAKDEEIWKTDYIGTLNSIEIFTEKMFTQRWGRIINLTSYHSQATYPIRHGYAGAKAGIAGMSRSYALTLARFNITVNCVAPGVTETARTRKFIEQRDVNEEKLLKRTPLRRFAKPEDIANVVAFLASDKAEFVTGQEWVVDGGYTISNYPGDY